jgi:hypothetical protein
MARRITIDNFDHKDAIEIMEVFSNLISGKKDRIEHSPIYEQVKDKILQNEIQFERKLTRKVLFEKYSPNELIYKHLRIYQYYTNIVEKLKKMVDNQIINLEELNEYNDND